MIKIDKDIATLEGTNLELLYEVTSAIKGIAVAIGITEKDVIKAIEIALDNTSIFNLNIERIFED